MTTMEPIDISGYEAMNVPVRLGAVPDLKWIAISDLVVDPSYQRGVRAQGRATVRRIAGDFEWVKFSPVVVSPVVGGRYAIIDGQHRTTAAALIGITSVPCQVVVADRDAQARAFVAINGNITKVSRQVIFAARVASGDLEAAAIAEACAAANVVVLRYPKDINTIKPGETMAVASLEAVFRYGGADLLIATLKAIRAAVGDAPGGLDSVTIKSVGLVLQDHREWLTHPRLVAAMEILDIETALMDARTEAVRRRGVSSSDILQARLIEHLERELG